MLDGQQACRHKLKPTVIRQSITMCKGKQTYHLSVNYKLSVTHIHHRVHTHSHKHTCISVHTKAQSINPLPAKQQNTVWNVMWEGYYSHQDQNTGIPLWGQCFCFFHPFMPCPAQPIKLKATLSCSNSLLPSLSTNTVTSKSQSKSVRESGLQSQSA